MSLLFMLTVASLLSGYAIDEFCGTPQCPFRPRALSCDNGLCYANSVTVPTESNMILVTSDNKFSEWSQVSWEIMLGEVNGIVPFSNGAIAVGGFNPKSQTGLYYSPDKTKSFTPLGKFPIVSSLRRFRPAPLHEDVYALGLTIDTRYEHFGAVTLSPDGKFTSWKFGPDFTVATHGYPINLHPVNEGVWLLTTMRSSQDDQIGSLHRSADYGKTWTDVDTGHFSFWDVTCDASGRVCAAVGSVDSVGRIYVSIDGGLSWELRCETQKTPADIVTHFVYADNDTRSIVATFCYGYIGNCTGMVFYSRDRGATWLSTEAPARNNLFAIEAGQTEDSVVISGSTPDGFGTFSILALNETLWR